MKYLLGESFYFMGEKSIVSNRLKSHGYSCWESCVFHKFCSNLLADCYASNNYIYKLEV